VASFSAPVILHYSDPEVQTGIEFGSECVETGNAGGKNQSSVRAMNSTASIVGQSPISPNEKSPVFISYSSSDDEQDFFDANEDFESADE
jgi:hypothetical protein